jgi:hypothetical protein
MVHSAMCLVVVLKSCTAYDNRNLQALQIMLDIPVHKSVVTISDLARFNVSTFGADTIIRHLTDGGDAVAPIFPNESVFMRQFRRRVMQEDEGSTSSSEEGDSSGHPEKGC